PGTAGAWQEARLRIFWETDRLGAGVDVPLGFAFAGVPGIDPFQSLLMGHEGPAWTNRFPMPYRERGYLEIEAAAPIRGTIRVRSTHGVAVDAGYLHAAYRQGEASALDAPLAGFDVSQRAHLAGVLLAFRLHGNQLRRATSQDSLKSGRQIPIPGNGSDMII